MSHLPAPDAQDQNSSSTNEESSRTSRTRVSRACKQCRSRKVRCDGLLPCDGCRRNRIDCVYQEVKPSKQQKSLNNLHSALNAAYKEPRGIHRKLGGLNRGHSNLQFISLDPKREHGTKAFLREELQRLSQSYVKNVHALHPFFDEPQEMCNEFVEDPVVQKGVIMPSLRNAHVLLIFALGACQFTNNTGNASTLQDKVYYSHAKAILRYTIGECNIHVAQALTLAALYTNQNGVLQDSLAHLCNARDIYTDVFKNNISISEEVKRGFWVYQHLASDIDNCFNCASFRPVPKHCSTLLPEGNMEQFPERVYWTKVNLRILLDALSDFARPYFPETREIDEEGLCDLGIVANKQIKTLEEWRLSLIPRLAWDETEPPSTDRLIASLQAEYYEGLAKLLRPYVGIAEYALYSNDHSTENELSKDKQEIVKAFLYWERYALSAFFCFDRAGAASGSIHEMCQNTSGSPIMLSNPVSTLHTQVA